MLDVLQLIPSEVLVGLVSSVVSGWQKRQAMQLELQRLQVERLQAYTAAADAAAARDSTSWGKRVRRMVLLLVAFWLFGWPMLAAILEGFGRGPTTWYVWSQSGGGFWPWGKGDRMWSQLFTGFVITPVHTHAAFAVIFYYFGASIVGSAKR